MLSLPHRLGWQATVGYFVKPGNTCRIFGDAELRVFPLFSLRHCFPFMGRLTYMTDIMALLLWDVNGRMYIHEKIMNSQQGFQVT